MRGKVYSPKPLSRYDGITPAYAGKRDWQTKPANTAPGSPPPMRGKAQWLKDKVSGFGITPAYAGKS